MTKAAVLETKKRKQSKDDVSGHGDRAVQKNKKTKERLSKQEVYLVFVTENRAADRDYYDNGSHHAELVGVYHNTPDAEKKADTLREDEDCDSDEDGWGGDGEPRSSKRSVQVVKAPISGGNGGGEQKDTTGNRYQPHLESGRSRRIPIWI
jgi:hypothetical protein